MWCDRMGEHLARAFPLVGHDFGPFAYWRDFDESNWALQNCKCFALCGSRWKYVWALELLARCSTDAACAFSDRSCRLFLRPSRSRLPSALLYVYFVCSIPCLASGCSGSNHSPRHLRIGVDSLHLPDPWSLHKLDVLLRRCAAPRACYCCLYRLGDLVGDSASSVTTGTA